MASAQPKVAIYQAGLWRGWPRWCIHVHLEKPTPLSGTKRGYAGLSPYGWRHFAPSESAGPRVAKIISPAVLPNLAWIPPRFGIPRRRFTNHRYRFRVVVSPFALFMMAGISPDSINSSSSSNPNNIHPQLHDPLPQPYPPSFRPTNIN